MGCTICTWCFYQIGRYELKTNKIQDVISRVGLSRRRVDLASRVSPMSLSTKVLPMYPSLVPVGSA